MFERLKFIKIHIIFILFFLFISGCAAVGPDYCLPETDFPKKWHTNLEKGLVAASPDPVALARWWNTLDDPLLAEMILRAARNNLDLKEARARVLEARARTGIASAGYFPDIDISGSGIRNGSGSGEESDFFSAGFDAGWELDIFGGTRREVEAAEANLEAVREDLHDVLVSLLAEVGINYVNARTLQTRIAIARENIKAQNDTYELTRFRFEAGLIDELAVKQALYNLESTRSQVPLLESELEAAMNRLAILMGLSPGTLHQELAESRPVPVPPLVVAVGIPADALRLRPDIRKAERQLAAQTARIGIATADLYPSFNFIGSIGLEAFDLGDLFDISNRVWRLGPNFYWKFFDAGAIRENIRVQSAIKGQFLAQYESAVLSALEEVENALTAYAKEHARRKSLAVAAEAANHAVSLAQMRYQTGLVEFNTVLDAQRSLLSFQDQLARSDGTITTNLIRLYKALGGGWESSSLVKDPEDYFSGNGKNEKQSRG